MELIHLTGLEFSILEVIGSLTWSHVEAHLN